MPVRYIGDINPENGGVWYNVNRKDWQEYGYGQAVRLTPCSDAGLQTNAFWIERVQILNPMHPDFKRHNVESVLSVHGWKLDSDGNLRTGQLGLPIRKGTAAFRQAIAECCVSYGLYDNEYSECVQLGPVPLDCSDRESPAVPDVTLRGNASIARYVQREHLPQIR
jgi:hypothetical protein